MTLEMWLAFVVAAILIAVSPGAGAIQAMATGMTHGGVRRGYWSIAGMEMADASTRVGRRRAWRLGRQLDRRVQRGEVDRRVLPGVFGRAAMAFGEDRPPRQIGTVVDGGRLGLFTRGFLVNATNPKSLVFFLAVLPQFVVPTAPLLPQYLTIAVTMVAVDLVVMGGLYTGLAVRLVEWLHTPRQQTILNRVFSGLFATAAVVLSLMRRTATT